MIAGAVPRPSSLGRGRGAIDATSNFPNIVMSRVDSPNVVWNLACAGQCGVLPRSITLCGLYQRMSLVGTEPDTIRWVPC